MTTMGQGKPNKFSAQRVTTGPDKSAGKNLLTGDSGVGKTHMLSTITSDDGRPIFLLPIEEGLKGASPLHAPAKFSDGADNPILPMTFAELMQALHTFRTEVNALRPPMGWVDAVAPLEKSAEQHAVLSALVNAYPFGLPPHVVSERMGRAGAAGVSAARGGSTEAHADAAARAIVEQLEREGRARRDRDGFAFVRPDLATWRRPHLHFGVDSLSGAEALIHREVAGRNNVSSMADKEYNALYAKALPLWQEMRDELDAIRRGGVHVWIVAHATKDIDASHSTGDIYHALDLMFRGSGKALNEIRQFWRQWADSIFYIVRDVSVQQGSKTKRSTASFRSRVLITTETATCRAKSRLPLPPVLPATWEDLRAAMKQGAAATPEKFRARINALLPRLDQSALPEVQRELDASVSNAARLAALLSRVEGLLSCAEDARAEAAALAQDGPAEGPAAEPSTSTPSPTTTPSSGPPLADDDES